MNMGIFEGSGQWEREQQSCSRTVMTVVDSSTTNNRIGTQLGTKSNPDTIGMQWDSGTTSSNI